MYLQDLTPDNAEVFLPAVDKIKSNLGALQATLKKTLDATRMMYKSGWAIGSPTNANAYLQLLKLDIHCMYITFCYATLRWQKAGNDGEVRKVLEQMGAWDGMPAFERQCDHNSIKLLRERVGVSLPALGHAEPDVANHLGPALGHADLLPTSGDGDEKDKERENKP